MNIQGCNTTGEAMPAVVEEAPVSASARWLGRILSGLVILFLLFDGAIKLVPWPVVTETMDRIGYGSSETLARSLGIITIVCTVLYSVPPTSILGAILLTGTGVVPDPHFTLRHGDEVRVEIEGLGELVNPVVTVGRAAPAAG